MIDLIIVFWALFLTFHIDFLFICLLSLNRRFYYSFRAFFENFLILSFGLLECFFNVKFLVISHFEIKLFSTFGILKIWTLIIFFQLRSHKVVLFEIMNISKREILLLFWIIRANKHWRSLIKILICFTNKKARSCRRLVEMFHVSFLVILLFLVFRIQIFLRIPILIFKFVSYVCGLMKRTVHIGFVPSRAI